MPSTNSTSLPSSSSCPSDIQLLSYFPSLSFPFPAFSFPPQLRHRHLSTVFDILQVLRWRHWTTTIAFCRAVRRCQRDDCRPRWWWATGPRRRRAAISVLLLRYLSEYLCRVCCCWNRKRTRPAVNHAFYRYSNEQIDATRASRRPAGSAEGRMDGWTDGRAFKANVPIWTGCWLIGRPCQTQQLRSSDYYADLDMDDQTRYKSRLHQWPMERIEGGGDQ